MIEQSERANKEAHARNEMAHARHEMAIHAIGSVLTGRIFDALKHNKYKGHEGELSADYLEKLKQLTAESWRKSFE